MFSVSPIYSRTFTPSFRRRASTRAPIPGLSMNRIISKPQLIEVPELFTWCTATRSYGDGVSSKCYQTPSIVQRLFTHVRAYGLRLASRELTLPTLPHNFRCESPSQLLTNRVASASRSRLRPTAGVLDRVQVVLDILLFITKEIPSCGPSTVPVSRFLFFGVQTLSNLALKVGLQP